MLFLDNWIHSTICKTTAGQHTGQASQKNRVSLLNLVVSMQLVAFSYKYVSRLVKMERMSYGFSSLCHYAIIKCLGHFLLESDLVLIEMAFRYFNYC